MHYWTGSRQQKFCSISISTIGRQPHDEGLNSRRPLRRLPLTAFEQQVWNGIKYDEHRSSNSIKWSSLKSHAFVLIKTKICLWRQRSWSQDTRFVMQSYSSSSPGVMVWRTIAYDDKSPFVFFA
ncbi:hypothetical protein TNIN_388231 [Trichonephila inaurata madagascariensis]|uniref:Uncharacterized protein n=1 Tax=Trichonephila inaurata madagascariensis TaxID=2747483 RepID=A0A8X7C1Y5_9ARAC|nr:hypothetical protein TNIN_388231 [Trichonephila inaurata madagascariensis]